MPGRIERGDFIVDDLLASECEFWGESREAALSAQRQLSLLVILHDSAKRRCEVQVIIATHSPILLGYPDAQIISFDGGEIHEIEFTETPPYQLYNRFLADPKRYLNLPFEDEPLLRDDGE